MARAVIIGARTANARGRLGSSAIAMYTAAVISRGYTYHHTPIIIGSVKNRPRNTSAQTRTTSAAPSALRRARRVAMVHATGTSAAPSAYRSARLLAEVLRLSTTSVTSDATPTTA